MTVILKRHDSSELGPLLETLAESISDAGKGDAFSGLCIDYASKGEVFKVEIRLNGEPTVTEVGPDLCTVVFKVAELWLQKLNPHGALRRLFEIVERSRLDGRPLRDPAEREGTTG